MAVFLKQFMCGFCTWGYFLCPEVGCDVKRTSMGGKGPAWAAGADITKLLQLSFPSPLPSSVVAELWGTIVTTYLWITPRVPIIELFEVCDIRVATLLKYEDFIM